MPRSTRNQPATTEAALSWTAGLSLRERRFVEEYLIDLNGKEAAIRAGLGKTPKSATEIACRMRRRATVAKAIGTLMNERASTTGSRIVEELGRVGFAKITDFVRVEDGRMVVMDTDKLTEDQQAAICEISETVGEHGRTIKVKLHDKMTALDRLAKILMMFDKKPADPREGYQPADLTDARERLEAMINQTAERLKQEDQRLVEILPPVKRIGSRPGGFGED